ncbi:hypothetical protein Ancab_006771 [Ancistrocladus abbreviatus]
MLMSGSMGIVYNPEALELFIMKEVFVVYSWLKQNGIPKPRLKTSDMARMLGLELEMSCLIWLTGVTADQVWIKLCTNSSAAIRCICKVVSRGPESDA